jgi:hypothetical protein
MDPITIEIAKLLFAGISAVSAAAGVWRSTRNQAAAAREFDRTLAAVQASPESLAAANELSIIPADIVADLERRADQCWTGYRKVLGGKYLPTEIDEATLSVQACVCRELSRLFKLGGHIPTRWRGQWDRYHCEQYL